MPEIDQSWERNERDRPYRRRSVLVSPDYQFSPPGSRWGGFEISHAQLRAVAKKSPTVSAILNLRVQQLQGFARPPRRKGDRGFEIIPEHNPAKLTKHDERVAEEITEFLLRCGWRDDYHRPDMAGWIAEIGRDRFILDAASTELVFNRRGMVSEYWPVDGGTIEINWSERYIPTTRYGKELSQPVAYVQVVNGQVETEFAADELIYAVARPISDITQGGYGLSELEASIDIVAAEILAIQYNSNYFDHGSVPPGILVVVGGTQRTVDEINDMWETDVKGVIGQHKPVALGLSTGGDAKWFAMKNSNRDMELGDFLDKVQTGICSVWGADPVEIGKRTASNSGGMSATDNTEAKIDLSRDRGLVPAVDWLERMINRHMMPHLAPGYIVRMTGIHAEDEEQKLQFLAGQLESGILTIREARKAMGLEEVPPGTEEGKWLDVPLNQQALQVWMQENGMGPAQQQAGLQGMSQAQRLQAVGQNGKAGSLAQPKKPGMAAKKPGGEVQKGWRPIFLT